MPNYDRPDDECNEFIARGLHHYHIIRLNKNVKTPGRVNRNQEFGYLGLRAEDLKGKSVLDIGALDGVITFNAERFGTTRLLAIDVENYELYDWGWDGPPAEFKDKGNIKNRVFHQLHKFFSSNAERKQKTVYDLSPKEDGLFDFVFFYGVLYHLRHPLMSLDKIRAVCKGAALVETHVCNVDPLLPSSLFYLDNVLQKAVTNWTGPSESCVVHWMRDAGFKSVWVEKTPRMRSRQRFIGFVESPTFKVSEAFSECGPDYFAASRKAVEEALATGSFGTAKVEAGAK